MSEFNDLSDNNINDNLLVDLVNDNWWIIRYILWNILIYYRINVSYLIKESLIFYKLLPVLWILLIATLY
jgi:hypothetical protein